MRRFTTKVFLQKGGVIKNQKNFRKNVQIIFLVVAFWLSLFDEHKHSVLLDLVINIVYIGHELCQGKTHAVVYTRVLAPPANPRIRYIRTCLIVIISHHREMTEW